MSATDEKAAPTAPTPTQNGADRESDAHTMTGSQHDLEKAPAAAEGEPVKAGGAEAGAVGQAEDAEAKRRGGGALQSMPPIPDGGLRAWLTILGAWFILYATFGYVNAFGVYEAYYQQNYLPNKTAFDISWIGSFQLFLQFAMGTIVGRLFDEGYFRYLLIGGSVLYIIGQFMISLAKEYYSIFLAQGLCLGLANGILFLPAVGCVSHHFFKRRALATGIVVTGSSVGGIVFPIMLNNLFKSHGFEYGVRAGAYMTTAAIIVANLTMTTRLPPRKKRPAHLQAKPDMKAIMTDVPYLINIAGTFCLMLGLFYPFFFLQLFAESKGLDENISFYSLTILNASSVFGRTIPNFLADKYGPYNLLVPCVFVASFMMWVLLACGSTGGVIAFAIVFGFVSGAYVSLLPSVNVSFAKNMAEVGIRIGLPFAFLGIAALIGTPICGALIGNGPEFAWWKASTFSGVVMFVGVALTGVARGMQAKRKGTQLV